MQGAEIRVLGPFEVVVGGHRIDVGGPRPRALLAVLASAGGRPVGVPTLVDQLWSDREPHREAGDRGAEAESLRILAVVLLDLGEQDRALQVAMQAAALAVETGHRPIEAGALNTLGSVRCRLGR